MSTVQNDESRRSALFSLTRTLGNGSMVDESFWLSNSLPQLKVAVCRCIVKYSSETCRFSTVRHIHLLSRTISTTLYCRQAGRQQQNTMYLAPLENETSIGQKRTPQLHGN